MTPASGPTRLVVHSADDRCAERDHDLRGVVLAVEQSGPYRAERRGLDFKRDRLADCDCDRAPARGIGFQRQPRQVIDRAGNGDSWDGPPGRIGQSERGRSPGLGLERKIRGRAPEPAATACLA